MKKIIISVICAACEFMLASCEQQLEVSVTPAVKMVPVSFEASIPDTKANLDGLNVAWASGDVIYVTYNASVSADNFSVYPNANYNVFPLTADSDGTVVSFSGYLPADLNETGCAVYGVPGLYQFYKSGNRINPRWVSQQTQTGVKDGVAANAIMMFAYTNGVDRSDIDFVGNKMHFRLGCALIKVSVKGSDIKKITLSTSAAAGSYTNYLGATKININLQTGGYGLVGGTPPGEYIQELYLIPEGGNSVFESGDYYFVIPASNLHTGAGTTPSAHTINDLKITYTKADNTEVSKTSENILRAEAGKIYKTGIDETKCSPE